MRNLLIVGLGGFAGAALRYLLAGWLQTAARTTAFPVGTLGVNVAGCLLIGILGGWAENLEALSPQMRLFAMVGLLGGFTTFSTFGYETMALLRDRNVAAALANTGLQVLFGFGAVWLGYALTATRG